MSYLNPPKVTSVRYAHNFIKTAVCELRFPVQLDLESKPPSNFYKKIRKNYPHFETQIVSTGHPEDNGEHRYLISSKQRDWTINLRAMSFAVETSKYKDFEDFFGKFNGLLSKASDLIDSDFFTRVGLRYINVINIPDTKPDGWIRPELIGALSSGVLGDVKTKVSVVQGALENGGEYVLRQKMQPDSSGGLEYYLDYDYFKNDVEFKELEGLIRYFHDLNFSFFYWCLGEKAIKYLGEGVKK